MSDEQLRSLERAWKASGSNEDEANYLRALRRLGRLTRARLELAACVGHVAAGEALSGEEPAWLERDPLCWQIDTSNSTLRKWDKAAGGFPCKRVKRKPHYALADVLGWLARNPPDKVSKADGNNAFAPKLVRALAAFGFEARARALVGALAGAGLPETARFDRSGLEDWLCCPCEEHARAAADASRLPSLEGQPRLAEALEGFRWFNPLPAIARFVANPPGPDTQPAWVDDTRDEAQVALVSIVDYTSNVLFDQSGVSRATARASALIVEAIRDEVAPWALGHSDPVLARRSEGAIDLSEAWREPVEVVVPWSFERIHSRQLAVYVGIPCENKTLLRVARAVTGRPLGELQAALSDRAALLELDCRTLSLHELADAIAGVRELVSTIRAERLPLDGRIGPEDGSEVGDRSTGDLEEMLDALQP